MTGLPIRSMFAASVAAASLAGCSAVGPDYTPPAPPAINAYTSSPLPEETASAAIPGGNAQLFLGGADVPGRWWEAFGSEPLTRLVEQALLANPDIDKAQAALREMHENYVAQRGTLFPQLGTDLSATRQDLGLGGGPYDLLNASVGVTYLLDAWGSVRRSVEAAHALEDYQRFQLEATYATLIANVVSAAIQQSLLSAQITATQELAAIQRQQVGVISQQLAVRAVTRGDVLAVESQLAATEANLPQLEKRLELARNQLSLLIGRFPGEGNLPLLTLEELQLPRELPLSLPSQLVEQRLDIQAAAALLHRASANIGVATANTLPQITLSGRNTTRLIGESFSFPFTGWSLAAELTQPVFSGGRLQAQRRASLEAYDSAAAEYRRVVLSAFTDVANVLTALRYDADVLRAQLHAEQTAKQSFDIARERFQAGAVSYLALLDAQRTYYFARIALTVAQANRYADTVALFHALGGGWWNREDVEPAKPAGLGLP
jgi:NodT family efflux transporter outer membrane factor (OMF) lipoprotein